MARNPWLDDYNDGAAPLVGCKPVVGGGSGARTHRDLAAFSRHAVSRRALHVHRQGRDQPRGQRARPGTPRAHLLVVLARRARRQGRSDAARCRGSTCFPSAATASSPRSSVSTAQHREALDDCHRTKSRSKLRSMTKPPHATWIAMPFRSSIHCEICAACQRSRAGLDIERAGASSSLSPSASAAPQCRQMRAEIAGALRRRCAHDSSRGR